MQEVVRLTESELSELKDLNNKYTKTMTLIGEYEAVMSDLQSQIEKVKEEKRNALSDYNTIKEKSQRLTKELSEKYGSGSVDLETGEVKPI